MRDIFLPIRQAYYTVLAGYLYLGSTEVHLFDVVPQNSFIHPVTGIETPVTYPYVVFAQQNLTVVSQKRNCEVYEATILLEIVTKYEAGKGGRKDADDIADQIYTRLRNPLPSQGGLQLGLTYLDSDFDQGREMTATHTVNRRFIQFKDSVSIKS